VSDAPSPPAPAPAPRKKRAEGTTREAILKAALELFSERGFHGTPVPLLAEKAGVATGSIYRHFESKEALANALYQHWRNAQLNAWFGGFPVHLSERAQFHELWRRMAAFYKANPLVFVWLEQHNHAAYLDEESLACTKRVLRPTTAFVKLAREKHLLKPLPAKLLVAIADGIFMGMVRFATAQHFELDEEVLDAAEQCCWEAMRK
jgi:AcrR family transcriptional regulator